MCTWWVFVRLEGWRNGHVQRWYLSCLGGGETASSIQEIKYHLFFKIHGRFPEGTTTNWKMSMTSYEDMLLILVGGMRWCFLSRMYLTSAAHPRPYCTIPEM